MRKTLFEGKDFRIEQSGNDIISLTKKEGIEYSRFDMKEGRAKHWYARQMLDFLYSKYGYMKPISVLFLGAALGAMPYELLRQNPNATVVCVDIDPESVLLLNQAILKPFGRRSQVVQEDAKKFVAVIPAESFDVVIIDIFFEDRTPTFLKENPFLQNCFRILRKGGVFMANIITQSSDLSYGILLRSMANTIFRVARDPQGKTNVVYMAS